MGYNISPNQKFTFQKGQFSHQWKYLIHTIMQCMSPKSTGFNEFSSNIATALVCLATDSVYNFSKMISDGMVKNVNNKVSKFLMYPRRARIAQSSALLPVADEPASPLRNVSQGEACPIGFSLDAEHDRANIAKTSTLPHELTSRVPSLAVDEGSLQLRIQELTDLCTSLQRQQSDLVTKFEAQELEINRLKARVKLLEDREGVKVSDDTEEMATILTSMDAASILTSGGVQVVPTATEVATATVSIPAGSDVVPTASPNFATATVVTPYTRRKGKEKMVETDTPKKKKFQEQMDIQMARQLEEEIERDAQRMNEQIARDVEVTRIHVEEELQMMINSLDRSNETTQQRKPWSKKQKRDYYMTVIKSNLGWKVKDFRGMTFEEIEAKFTTIWKQIKNFIPMGSKEEAERFKRKRIRFEQESMKKLKTSEEVLEEKVKEMMQLVPIEELYVKALQVKHPIIDWKHLDREDLNQLWALVKESLNIRPASSDKEMELWLYDSCEVHHVTSKDNEIFMLIEKDYPLGKGLEIVMISYNLQGRIVGNKMHKAFPLPVMEFPLPGEVPTASEESSHCQKKREATAVKIALLLKSRINCQSKSNDSYAKAERVSDDTEEMETVLTSMDAVSILTSGGVQVVPTAAEVATATVSILAGSDVVPTASPNFTTATVVTPYTRRKGKEKMVETDTSKKKKFQEQMDIQMARQLDEEMERNA
nr:synaptobrevin, longin-like domain protein [Tanacetum cinerariifolium]